jgi:hypothetical protein
LTAEGYIKTFTEKKQETLFPKYSQKMDKKMGSNDIIEEILKLINN